MYLNQIDQLIDVLLNIYYFKLIDKKILLLLKTNLISSLKRMNKKELEKNEKKSIEFINKFDNIIKFIEQFINENKIKELFITEAIDPQFKNLIKDININEKENITITNIIVTYLYFYIFLLFGYFIDDNIEFINILLDIKNKYETNFLSSSNIAELQKYQKYISNMLFLLDDIDNLDKYKDDKQYNNIISDLKQLDKEILKKLFLVNIDIKPHNIVKYVLFNEKYLKNEKKIIYKIIETSYLNDLEYKYIDIVESLYEKIDYSNIESLFDYDDIKKGYVEDIYNMLMEKEITIDELSKNKLLEYKINELFRKKILIPITEDYLRYHKDTESYETNIGSTTKIDIKDRTNKKNNTKIRYIVTKMNKMMELYNEKNSKEKKEEIMKIFYQPMINRNIVLINDIEETNIIRKLNLQIESVVQNNEYYSDLIKLRNYSYINFKNLSKDGFSININNTIDAIRYNNFKYEQNKNNKIEWRVISNRNKANIVGVLLSNNLTKNNIISNIYCNKVNNTVNITNFHSNGYNMTLYNIKKMILEDKSYNKMIYWLFNKKKDIYEENKFNIINNNSNDYYINLLGQIYDYISELTYKKILYKLRTLKYKNLLYIQNIINETQNDLLTINNATGTFGENYLSNINIIIYYTILKCISIDYDKNDNKIPGIESDLIKLPIITIPREKIPIITITKKDIYKLDSLLDQDDILLEDSICQHIITWKQMLRYKKYDPNRFNQLLYEFTKKYLITNQSGDYICKSCYEMIEIKRYISNYIEEDSVNEYNINEDTNNIILEVYLDTELENITGYEKYNKLIKNVDKEIDRLVNYIDYKYYIGSSNEYKLRRHVLIKNIIDLVTIQYDTLYSKNLEERNKRTNISKEKYGCRETEAYFFKNDNELFTYSSKEEDKFKFIKRNVLFSYLIICMLLELNNNQIIYFTLDKITNYITFDKIGFNLFDNLKIHINKTNNIIEMKKYKLLCFVIYYLTGIMINKYNLWFNESIKQKPNTINKELQKKFIHTICDLLNSILNNNITNKQNYLYNTISTKFYNKLKTVYSSINADESIKIIESFNKKKISLIDNKLKYNIKIVEPIQIKDLINDGNYIIKSPYGLRPSYLYPLVYRTKNIIEKINYLKEISNKTKYDKLKTKLYDESLIKLAILYNLDGTKRNVPLNDITLLDNMKKDDYNKLVNNIRNIRTKELNKIDHKNKFKEINLDLRYKKADKIITTLSEIINKTNIESYVEQFIEEIEELIGKDVNINNQNIYLRHIVYIIDHDYTSILREPIIILSNDNKIKFKKNDDYFKQDIYYYQDQTNNITMYYSIITRQYIGYKEKDKEVILVSNSGCFIKIQESIMNELKYLGFDHIYYDIKSNEDNNEIINKANYSINKRINNLRNIINQTQKIIYQIKNRVPNNIADIISSIYIKKLSNITTINDLHDRIFGDWIKFSEFITADYINPKYKFDIKIVPKEKYYLSVYNLTHTKTLDQLILVYYIDNLLKLYKLQKDEYHKINVIYLILNIIDSQYKTHLLYNDTRYDIHTKKLKLSLQYDSYIQTEDNFYDIQDIDYENMTQEQINQLKEEKLDDYEMNNALDTVNDDANKDFGDEDVLELDRVSGDY